MSVPVLSEQITDVQPSVSTDGSERTIAFFLAIRRVPNARHVVMTAGRPSGMAATARRTGEGVDEWVRMNEQTESNSNLEIIDSTTKP